LRQGSLPGVAAVLLLSRPEGMEYWSKGNARAELMQGLFDRDTDHPTQVVTREGFTMELKDLGNDNVLMHGYAVGTNPSGSRLYFWGRGDAEAVARVLGAIQRNLEISSSVTDHPATGLLPTSSIEDFLAAPEPDQQALYRRLVLSWLDNNSVAPPPVIAARRAMTMHDVPGLADNVRRLLAAQPDLRGDSIERLVFQAQRQLDGQ
jgi:hypothetical protein